MNFDIQYIQSGMERGLERAKSRMNSSEILLRGTEFDQLSKLFVDWQDELNGRLVELFAELATIAIIARAEYDEPDLTDEELITYLSQTIAFVNSFSHKVVDDPGGLLGSDPSSWSRPGLKSQTSTREEDPFPFLAEVGDESES